MADDDGWEDEAPADDDLDAPVLSVEGFEGRLDRLIELCRSGRVDLARLSIAALVDAFDVARERSIAAGSDGDPFRLTRWSAWLAMAAQLVLMRSRLMQVLKQAESDRVPVDPAAGRDAGHREAMSRVADWLERRPQLGRDVFRSGRLAGEVSQGPGSAGVAGEGGLDGDVQADLSAMEDCDILSLFRACLALLRLPSDPRRYQPRSPVWGAVEAASHIVREMQSLPDGSDLTAYLPPDRAEADEPDPLAAGKRARLRVAAVFSGSLELARRQSLVLEQSTPWSPIHLYRRQPSDQAVPAAAVVDSTPAGPSSPG